MNGTAITASMLYDLVNCPHRVSMDLFGDSARRDRVSPFVQLLWERGRTHEEEVIAALGEPFLDLSIYADAEKDQKTLEAMDRGEGLIYAGRITALDLIGDPDLLRREGNGYVAGDIKSGAGEEDGGSGDEGRPKKHYAVQLALFTDILERLGRSAGRRAFVWDIHGEEVLYDFEVLYGTRNPRRLWDDYQAAVTAARAIVTGAVATSPAYASGVCKNCVWYGACLTQLRAADDLTLIPELGRSKRDVMINRVSSITEFAGMDPAVVLNGKKTVFPGIGADMLAKLQARARLIALGGLPYLRSPIIFPVSDRELFFDVEVDPMRDICYLHGFIERRGGDNTRERYVACFAEEPTSAAEMSAFAEAWQYLRASQRCTIYYYSKYERTVYRKLQRKYPQVCDASAVEELFDPSRATDLYFDVVLKATEWPTQDFSIKTLATYLGFSWRDPHPSGAASIEWFDRWVRGRDPSVRQQLLAYNEDDCRATRVLLDGIRAMDQNLRLGQLQQTQQ